MADIRDLVNTLAAKTLAGTIDWSVVSSGNYQIYIDSVPVRFCAGIIFIGYGDNPEEWQLPYELRNKLKHAIETQRETHRMATVDRLVAELNKYEI